MTDRELLRDYVRQQSSDAFARVYERYSAVAYSTSLRILKDPSAAEDATQATFIVFVKRAASLPETIVLAGWFYLTAQRCALEIRRAEARRTKRELEVSTMNRPSSASGLWKEVRPELDSALAALPQEQREALVLRYFQGLSIADAALTAGCPTNTLDARLKRGLARLRERFGKRSAALTSATFAAILTENATHAAPAHLTETIVLVCTDKAVASTSAAAAASAVSKIAIQASALTAKVLVFGLIAALLSVSAAMYLRQSPPLTTVAPAAVLPTTVEPAFYVSPSGSDSSAGTQAAPLRTIAKAATIAKPGTTIHVAPGTYNSGPFTTNVSGTATARIRYVSDIPWKAAIRTTGAPMDSAWTNDGSYVDIEGFDLSGNGRIGIVNNGSFCRIIGNHIHDIPAADVAGMGGGGIIHTNYAAHDSDTIGNTIDHIGPATPTTFVYGISHSNLGGHIVNNICYMNSGFGIHAWHAANRVTIANNLIYSNGKGGIVVGAGDSPGGVTADNFIVSNNILLNNGGAAISETGRTGPGNRYLNNLIWKNTRGIAVKVTPVGTVSADPKLVNFQADGSGDYRSTSSSPCVDGGTFEGAPLTDFNGDKRPQGKGFDIGPFEFSR